MPIDPIAALLENEMGVAQMWAECVERIRPQRLIPSPQMWEEVQRVSDAVTALISNGDEELAIWVAGPMAGRRIDAQLLTDALLQVAAKEGPLAASKWLDRILNLKSASSRVVAGIHGLQIAGDTEIEGVRFVPTAQLNETQSVRDWLFRHRGGPDAYSLDCVAILEFKDVAVGPEDNGMQDKLYEWLEKVRSILRAITYGDGGAPSLGEYFAEFVDEDLAYLRLGSGYASRVENAPRPMLPITLTEKGKAAAVQIFKLPAGLRRQVELASERLATARRRVGDADKSIDLSIAFEALLGTDRFDFTYKLSLRSALALGGDTANRKRVKGAVKDLYQIRGKAAHGAALHPADNAAQKIQSADVVCMELISRITELGREVDWELTEFNAQLTAAPFGTPTEPNV